MSEHLTTAGIPQPARKIPVDRLLPESALQRMKSVLEHDESLEQAEWRRWGAFFGVGRRRRSEEEAA